MDRDRDRPRALCGGKCLSLSAAIDWIEDAAHIHYSGNLPGRECGLTTWSQGYEAWVRGDASYSPAEARERLRLWRQDRLCEALQLGPLADHALPCGRWWEPVVAAWRARMERMDAEGRQACVDGLTVRDCE